MMTLEEAIKHCKDVALSCTNKECALEHFQLLKWLQEYSKILEKQGERKPKNESTDTCDSLSIKSKEFPAGETRDFGYFSESADKIEPKFHEGEWIVWNDKFYKVNYNGCGYELIDQNGLSTSLEYGTINENSHLWTIADAKAGDVLASKDGDNILIFRNLDTNTSFSSYYNIARKGELGWSNSSFIPATKEQHDNFMKAMTDAGYTFDFEKKELKKIGQQEVTKISDQVKDSKWSEEDEKMLDNCINALGDSSFDTYEIEEWVKSLKQRIGG